MPASSRFAPPPLMRDYGRRAIRRLEDCLADNPILVSPTGSGKTVILASFCRRLSLRVLWVAHRRELISQAAAHLDKIGFDNYIATSVQKQARRPLEDVDLIVVDECHHAIKDSQYQKLFDAGVPVVGATATPFRLDGRGLGDLFGRLVVAATPRQLVSQGYIQEPVIYSHPAPDMTGAKKIGGDWSLKELGRRFQKPKLMADIVETWKRQALGLKTIVFAPTIDYSRALVSSFLLEGIDAEHLDGKTPKKERDAILARLRTGETALVSNVGIATEGFDLPALDCAIMARATASLCLWLQMCGRVMRDEGEALILDHAGNAIRHGSPTRQIRYTLDPGGRQKPEPLGLKMCPECLLMVRVGVWICPDCGNDMSPISRAIRKADAGELVLFSDRMAVWNQVNGDRAKYKAIFGEMPVVIDGELIDISKPESKRIVYAHYVQKAWDRDYAMGWARGIYKKIFGHWPGSRLQDEVTKFLNKKWRS